MKNDFRLCKQASGISDGIQEHILTVQASMERAAEGCFLEPALHDLRVLIGFTVEFHYYLQISCTHSFCLSYVCESTFSAVESFQNVTHAYHVLENATQSRIERNSFSIPLLKEQFASMFDEFEREANFGNRCRLLLDLFKLQIVFAGISYDG